MPHFLHFFVLLVLSLFKIVLKQGAEMLSCVPYGKKAGVHLTGRICALDKPHSGMSYSALGCECSGNGSAIYVQ